MQPMRPLIDPSNRWRRIRIKVAIPAARPGSMVLEKYAADTVA